MPDRDTRPEAQGRAVPDIIVITGLSGSGMTAATKAFEDLGYFCVDNLPLTLLPTFARLVQPDADEKAAIERAALVINIREGRFLSEFQSGINALRASGLDVFVLFLEAADAMLQRRFSESRRPHPADDGNNLLEAIEQERTTMSEIRLFADSIIDTSDHTVHTLRRLLIERFTPEELDERLRVQLVSFGQKYGTPRELDLLFDVRHLPNPYFVADLRELSGHSRRIVEYLRREPEVNETLRRLEDLLDYLLPKYKAEGKAYVSIGIGCTGGRHRSVMIANALARHFRQAGHNASAVHRDVKKVKRRRSTVKTATKQDETGEAVDANNRTVELVGVKG